MSEYLNCGTHGKQPATFVCCHISKSMKTGNAVGFYWSKTDGDYDAICEECNELSDQQWDAQKADLVNLLCLGCFKVAANLNDVKIEGAA